MITKMMRRMMGSRRRRKEEIHNEVLGAIGFSYQCSGVWRSLITLLIEMIIGQPG